MVFEILAFRTNDMNAVHSIFICLDASSKFKVIDFTIVYQTINLLDLL